MKILRILLLCTLLFPLIKGGPGVTLYADFSFISAGARQEGLSGASVADSKDAGDIFISPVTSSKLPGFNFSSSGSRPFYGDSHLNISLNSYAMTYRFNALKFGVGAGFSTLNFIEAYKENVMLLNFSFPVFETFMLGLNVKNLSKEYLPDDGSDPFFSAGKTKSGLDMDFGGLVIMGDTGISFTGHNLLAADLGLREKSALSRVYKLGLAKNIRNILNASAAAILEPRAGRLIFDYAFGTEFYLYPDRAFFRAGFDGGKVSAGLGFRNIGIRKIKLNFDYSYSVPYQLPDLPAHTITLGVNYE